MEQDYNINPSGYIYGRDPKATIPFWNIDTLKSLNEEIDNLNAEINNLQLEIQQLETEKQNLQNNINSLNSRIQVLETENQALESNISDLNAQIQQLQAEKQNLQNNINSLNARIQELETENQALEGNISDLNAQIQQLQAEKQNLQNNINSLNARIQELETENQNLQNNVSSLNSQIQELNNSINNLETENQGLSTELSNYPDYMVGFKPFPDGTVLNYTIPKNSSIQLTEFVNRFPNIICDKVNINFLQGQFSYTWKSLPPNLNLNDLAILYPPSNIDIVSYTQPLVKKITLKGYNIYESRLNYYINLSTNASGQSPYYPKVILFDQFNNSPNNHNSKISLKFISNTRLGSGAYNQNCLIFDYGNVTLTKLNVTIESVTTPKGTPTVQDLVNTGMTIFVSDNQYDLFAADPNFSLFGSKLRRLSEYVESEWTS